MPHEIWRLNVVSPTTFYSADTRSVHNWMTGAVVWQSPMISGALNTAATNNGQIIVRYEGVYYLPF